MLSLHWQTVTVTNIYLFIVSTCYIINIILDTEGEIPRQIIVISTSDEEVL